MTSTELTWTTHPGYLQPALRVGDNFATVWEDDHGRWLWEVETKDNVTVASGRATSEEEARQAAENAIHAQPVRFASATPDHREQEFTWTIDPGYRLPVLAYENYFASIGRVGDDFWWDVDANYGDGVLISSDFAPTELEARAGAEQAIREHLASVIDRAKAVQDALVALHSNIVQRARETAPDSIAHRFPDWIAGYSEGVEHALETLAGGGPKAEAFLTALRNHQA